VLSNGTVLVTGGFGNSENLASAELYDPASGTWATTGSLNTARYLHTATLLPNGKVLVAGGAHSFSSLARTELYNPVNGTWTTIGSLNTARYGHTATLLSNGELLVAGGFKFGYLASAELGARRRPDSDCYDNTALTPIAGTFSNLPDGAIVNVNGNNLQVSYEGHGGNDLILTVVP
jgi:hypothetical protein